MGKHNIKITILIIVLLLLLTAIGLLVTGYMHIGQELHDKQMETIRLERSIEELDKYLADYTVHGDDPEEPVNVQRTAEDLQIAYNKIAELEKRVAQLKAEKKASAEEIKILEERIKILKVKVYEKSKNSIINFGTAMQVLINTLDSIQNESLIPTDGNPTGDNSPYIAEIQRLKRNIEQLNGQLRAINKLRVINFEFSNLKNGYEVKNRRYFKKTSMETLRVCFDIPGDIFAALGSEPKELYLLYYNPQGLIELNTEKGYSGRSKGSNPFMYSASTLFSRGRQTREVCMEFRPKEYMNGIQKVQIRCEGCPENLGEETFEIGE